MQGAARHQCVIYEGSPAKHLGGLAGIISRKLQHQYRCLYLNSPTMVDGIRPYLAARGMDVAQEVDRGALVLSSGQSLVDGRFDTDHMLALLSDAVDSALNDGYAGLYATGDMTWEFGGEKNFEKLLDYEHGLEQLFARQPALSGLCQYHADTVPKQAVRDALYTHEAIYISETLSRINPHYLPLDAQLRDRPHIREADVRTMIRCAQQAAAW